MSFRIIRAGDYQQVKWKNGGGTTAVIGVGPGEVGIDDFDWRVSMAEIAADGPFSIFPNVTRLLVMLEGNGMTLDMDGHGHHFITPLDHLIFDGGAAAHCTLHDGLVRDLNIMVRRSSHRVRLDHAGDATTYRLAAQTSVLFALSPTKVELESGTKLLATHDTLIGDFKSATGALIGIAIDPQ